MNTLNNIHALVDIDTEKAKQTIVELSRLMRYVLYESNNRLISLSKELQFLNHYIELMRIRYTDKVRIDVSFPTDTGEVQVPPLLFVSFVENAFKHGVSYQHASFVSVCLQVVGEEIHFVCSNSNYYRSEDQHHGIGLDNIRKRLRLLFGERYKLSIDDTADCFDVQLLVPVS
jgi:LytS/YehU family sensor histidine kinase